jgi:hypothetical protein
MRISASGLALVGVLTVAGDRALARSTPANIGTQSNSTSPGNMCYQWGEIPGFVGIQMLSNAGCSTSHWTIPIAWENASPPGLNRTITVTGRTGSSSGFIQCQATVYDLNGNVASQSSAPSITTISTYSSINLTVNYVPPGGFGSVACSMSFGDALLLGINYNP